MLCPPHLAEQWQTELRDKFHIDAELVLASTARGSSAVSASASRCSRCTDHVIVSTDFIKAERRRDDFVRTCPELVIVDEAHAFASPVTMATTAAASCATSCSRARAKDEERHLILVTATPHSGKEDAFRSLLALLDPRFANLPEDLSGGEANEAPRGPRAPSRAAPPGDIRAYLDTDTRSPSASQADDALRLTPEYRRLFDQALTYAARR